MGIPLTYTPKSGNSRKPTSPAPTVSVSCAKENIFHVQQAILDIQNFIQPPFFAIESCLEVLSDYAEKLLRETDGELLPNEFASWYENDEWFRGYVENRRIYEQLMARFSDNEYVDEQFGFLFAFRNILHVERELADFHVNSEHGDELVDGVANKLIDMVDGEHFPSIFVFQYVRDEEFRNDENKRTYQLLLDKWLDDEWVQREFLDLFDIERSEHSY